jgi:hypothetical protein
MLCFFHHKLCDVQNFVKANFLLNLKEKSQDGVLRLELSGHSAYGTLWMEVSALESCFTNVSAPCKFPLFGIFDNDN